MSNELDINPNGLIVFSTHPLSRTVITDANINKEQLRAKPWREVSINVRTHCRYSVLTTSLMGTVLRLRPMAISSAVKVSSIKASLKTDREQQTPIDKYPSSQHK